MISVVIPTCDDERALFATLSALVPAAVDGTVREVIVVDGGSHDGTARIADLTGCHFIQGAPARAVRLQQGAAAAKGPWLMFLLPGAALEEGWSSALRRTLQRVQAESAAESRALHFRLVRSRASMVGGLAALGARLRAFVVGAGDIDQGLVIHGALYRALGGVRPLPALEITDLARRVGRRRLRRTEARLTVAPAEAAAAPRRMRRALGVGLLALRVPPWMVARLYA